MAEVVLNPALAIQRWRSDYFKEYIRESRFKAYMGKRSNSIIQVVSDLEGKPGDTVHLPMIFRIQGGGVSGSQVLVGNEADMPQGDYLLQTDWVRNGVVVPKSTQYRSAIDLMSAAKDLLRGWFSEKLRDSLIAEMGSIIVPGPITNDNFGNPVQNADNTVAFGFSTSTQRNAYLTNNSDRILFGSKKSNLVSGNFDASLANITLANDRLSSAVGNLAKRIAKTAGGTVLNTGTPGVAHIRPYLTPNGGQEFYVCFCDTNSFRDIAADPAVIQANVSARAREGAGMDKNPIFQDGDLIYRGVIYVEMPELDSLTIPGAAASGGNVGVAFLCGAQAIGLAYTQMIEPKVDMDRDYKFRPGVGFEECRGQKKLSYNGRSLGVVPIYTYSQPDA